MYVFFTHTYAAWLVEEVTRRQRPGGVFASCNAQDRLVDLHTCASHPAREQILPE